MRKIITLLFSITFITTALYAQSNNPLINSGQVIQEGIELHDKENYKEAIEKFKLVSRSDTNYHTAIYELCNSYNYNKEYKKAIETAELGLSLKTRLEPSFYTSLANVHSANQNSLKAYHLKWVHNQLRR